MKISNKNFFIKNVILRWMNGEDIDVYDEIKQIYPQLEAWTCNDFHINHLKWVKLVWSNKKIEKLYFL